MKNTFFGLTKDGQLIDSLNGKPFIDYHIWERQVTDILIDLLECSNGDAQGIVECYPSQMLMAYNEGLTPEEVAFKIDNQEWTV